MPRQPQRIFGLGPSEVEQQQFASQARLFGSLPLGTAPGVQAGRGFSQAVGGLLGHQDPAQQRAQLLQEAEQATRSRVSEDSKDFLGVAAEELARRGLIDEASAARRAQLEQQKIASEIGDPNDPRSGLLAQLKRMPKELAPYLEIAESQLDPSIQGGERDRLRLQAAFQGLRSFQGSPRVTSKQFDNRGNQIGSTSQRLLNNRTATGGHSSQMLQNVARGTNAELAPNQVGSLRDQAREEARQLGVDPSIADALTTPVDGFAPGKYNVVAGGQTVNAEMAEPFTREQVAAAMGVAPEEVQIEQAEPATPTPAENSAARLGSSELANVKRIQRADRAFLRYEPVSGVNRQLPDKRREQFGSYRSYSSGLARLVDSVYTDGLGKGSSVVKLPFPLEGSVGIPRGYFYGKKGARQVGAVQKGIFGDLGIQYSRMRRLGAWDAGTQAVVDTVIPDPSTIASEMKGVSTVLRQLTEQWRGLTNEVPAISEDVGAVIELAEPPKIVKLLLDPPQLPENVETAIQQGIAETMSRPEIGRALPSSVGELVDPTAIQRQNKAASAAVTGTVPKKAIVNMGRTIQRAIKRFDGRDVSLKDALILYNLI